MPGLVVGGGDQAVDTNSNESGEAAAVTEVVGRFSERDAFQAAVEALRAAGFARTDLSVLDSHVALSVSESDDGAWKQTLAGLVGEIKYMGPIGAAGLIMLSSGMIGAAIAGVIAAGVTGVALKELLDDIKATPHTEAFARALEGGALLLWVRAQEPEKEKRASGLLIAHGAADVHTHRRPIAS